MTPERRITGSHTPGPWNVEEPVDSAGQMIYVQISAGKDRIGTTGVYGKRKGKTTGNVYKDDTGTSRHRPHITAEEAMANASLIAASPDLLQACRDLLTAWETEQQAIPSALAGHPRAQELHADGVRIRAQARAAIAAAK